MRKTIKEADDKMLDMKLKPSIYFLKKITFKKK